MAESIYLGQPAPVNIDPIPPNNGDVLQWSSSEGAWINASTGGGGTAPANATYWVNTPNAELSAETNMSALASGLVFVTTATGVPSSVPIGTGVATALGVNVGSAGAFVVNGGALGTPASGTLTNCTGYPTSALSGQVALANGGTGANLVDPNADRILFWDDSAGAVTWLAPGNSIAITTTTLDTIQDIRTSATPVFAGVDFAAAGVRATGANGVLTLLGLGSGADESLLIDLNTTTNAIGLSSGSGATTLSWTGNLDLGGHIALVDGAMDSAIGVFYQETFTSDPGYLYGAAFEVQVNEAAEVTTQVIGIDGYVQNLTGNTQILSGGLLGLSGRADQVGSGNVPGGAIGVQGTGRQRGTGEAEAIGLYGLAMNNSTGATNINLTGVYAQVRNTSTGTAAKGYALYADTPTNSGGGTLTTAYGVFIKNQLTTGGTTDYAIWMDGSGGDCNGTAVTRFAARGDFAGYNPCFTVYTPDLANFERTIIRWGDTGVFGADNRAYLGVEVGGTGTDRPVNLIGANYSITSTLTPAVTDTTANSCGTGTQTIVGNDNAGKVTVIGSAGTSCTVTFATAFTNAPSCTVTNETTAALVRATSTVSTVILAGVFAQNDVLAYICIGR